MTSLSHVVLSVDSLQTLISDYADLVAVTIPFHKGEHHDLLVVEAPNLGPDADPKPQTHRLALGSLQARGLISSYRYIDGLPTHRPIAILTVPHRSGCHVPGDQSGAHEEDPGEPLS